MVYQDPVLAKLVGLLNAEGPSELKNRYFFGDPLVVPRSQLPAVFITKDQTRIDEGSNAEDESRMVVVLNVVYDLTRDFNQAFNDINSANTLYDVVEGRNADYTLKPTSLAYILREHQALDQPHNLWINHDTPLEPEYGVTVNKRGEGVYTVEAVLRIMVVHQQLRPGM